MTFMVLVCERDSRQQGVGESDEVRTLTPQVFQGLIALSWASERQVRQVHSGKEKVNPATVQTSNDSAENVFSTSHELADDVLLEEVLSRHKRAKTSSRSGVQRSTSSAASWSLPQVVSARTPRQVTLFLGLTGCVAVTAAVGYTNNVVFSFF